MRQQSAAKLKSCARRICAALLVTASIAACTPHGKTPEDEQRQKTAQVVADAAVNGDKDRLLSLASPSTEPERQVERLISSAAGKSSASEVNFEKNDESAKRYVVTVGQEPTDFFFELEWNGSVWELVLDAQE